jgi:4-hydroxybenzoate polyprenyltransferase
MMGRGTGERILDYLRIGRAHTASMEMGFMPLAAYLGGVSPLLLPVLAVLGWIVHVNGFGMNSVTDFVYGFDAADPAKAHHPLPAGRLTVTQAWLFVMATHMAALAGFLLLSRSYYADAALAVYIVAGWWYNIYAKRHKVAGIVSIGVSFAALFLATSMIAGAWPSALTIMIAAYMGLYNSIGVMVAGDIKDLTTRSNEVNVMRMLGVRLSGDELTVTRAATAWAVALNMIAAALLTGIAAASRAPWFWVAAIAVLAAGSLAHYALTLMRPGPFRREWRLKVWGAGQAWSYVLLILAVIPLMWSWLPGAVVLFLVVPVIYFYAMNRIMWPRSGSGWAPGV